MAYGQQEPGGGWRSRYKRPDGTLGSKSGFSSETAAEKWGNEQEALIRRNMWIDPRDAETLFGEFVEEWLSAVSPPARAGHSGQVPVGARHASFAAVGDVAVDRHLQQLHRDREVGLGVARGLRGSHHRDDLRHLLHDPERGGARPADPSEPVLRDPGDVGGVRHRAVGR
jgi:hypothetical protein